MGAKCCTDRKDANPRQSQSASVKIKDADGEAANGQTKKEVSFKEGRKSHKGGRGSVAKGADRDRKTCSARSLSVAGKNSKMSLLYGITGDDALAFDEAFEDMNIEAFVKLLKSPAKLGKGQLEEMPPHPWAKDPASVGALAATQLAVLASDEEHGEARSQHIRAAGAVEPLADFLGRDTPLDKVHAAVITLVFLTSVDVIACADLGARKDSVEDMARRVGDETIGLGCQAGISTILVNVLCEYHDAAVHFVNKGGADQLLRALRLPAEQGDDDVDFFRELLENILEMLDSEDADDGPVLLPALQQSYENSSHQDSLSALAEKYVGTELEDLLGDLFERLASTGDD
eukprot:gnl/TRDRNA2_/TRDRNA2_156043_c0_seq1.p1 gnl/TRDRNA2_/TRDRNA2_156043_c0~~gnl/TRDRNA2_/TRDRNA2_156043_c0_seq1.p1  ORF type:complete len:346 (-),score=77.94 gnl/TRDRNA2_/TRDRNA2_156043_c0_seq1:148-1185(-)